MAMASRSRSVSEDAPREMRRNAGRASQLLKALANEHRLMVLCALAEDEHSVSELNEMVDLSQSALSQHLARLREDGLVTTRREGLTIHYSLGEPLAASIVDLLYRHYCKPARKARK